MPDAPEWTFNDELDGSGRLSELSGLEMAGSDNFFARVQKSIERRSAAAQVAAFACELSPALAIEIGQVFAHALRVTAAGKTKTQQ